MPAPLGTSIYELYLRNQAQARADAEARQQRDSEQFWSRAFEIGDRDRAQQEKEMDYALRLAEMQGKAEGELGRQRTARSGLPMANIASQSAYTAGEADAQASKDAAELRKFLEAEKAKADAAKTTALIEGRNVNNERTVAEQEAKRKAGYVDDAFWDQQGGFYKTDFSAYKGKEIPYQEAAVLIKSHLAQMQEQGKNTRAAITEGGRNARASTKDSIVEPFIKGIDAIMKTSKYKEILDVDAHNLSGKVRLELAEIAADSTLSAKDKFAKAKAASDAFKNYMDTKLGNKGASNTNSLVNQSDREAKRQAIFGN